MGILELGGLGFVFVILSFVAWLVPLLTYWRHLDDQRRWRS